MPRLYPNILITGTPTVGKTSTCTQLISLASDAPDISSTKGPIPILLRHLQINQLVKDRGCHEGWDEGVQSWIVDEERLLGEVGGVIEEGGEEGGEGEQGEKGERAVEGKMGEGGAEGRGGWLIDWHACDLFPAEWIDLVVVLRCERTDVLWDRLKARSYADSKLQENLDAEIFGVLLEEAREAFDEEMVVELKSETSDDIDENCERIMGWITKWMDDRRQK